MTADLLAQVEQVNPCAAPAGADAVGDVAALLAAARGLAESMSGEWRLLNLAEAAEAASLVEDLSRITGYLQLLLAGAIERHRPAETLGTTPAPPGTAASELRATDTDSHSGASAAVGAAGTASQGRSREFREFRSTADFLRARLRISRGEAKRRLGLAAAILPGSSITGHPLPPPFPLLADTCARGLLSISGAELIVQSLEQAEPRLEADALESMEEQLAAVGARQDHDFLFRTAQHWLALLDQETPPDEKELTRFQGIFPGRRRNGLNHLHIYCTGEQHEALTTAMNSGANPRAEAARMIPSNEDAADCSRGNLATSDTGPAAPGPAEPQGAPDPQGASENNSNPAGTVLGSASAPVSGPTRPQQLLNGLLGAVRAGLASGGVPAAGGLRPQVMVNISHEALLAGLPTRVEPL
ncbi:13E12 repeat family protein [Arthrobacter zhangbolii]|uniref:13E12 repeat family protein n=1 Tax=Arthrobacter zhangbolii TaxID=2886936 RepID=A0A9X1S9K2_9MICC|nr:DUF222 domain-containing protein [Arthrobacter zhangbolii]MCC3272606.1 13E12 repeat family protein [Arthrobacter zhangbolii]UON91547.1 13E12 repeat family protein [Arthrobacter zhangbolii]